MKIFGKYENTQRIRWFLRSVETHYYGSYYINMIEIAQQYCIIYYFHLLHTKIYKHKVYCRIDKIDENENSLVQAI